MLERVAQTGIRIRYISISIPGSQFDAHSSLIKYLVAFKTSYVMEIISLAKIDDDA